MKTHKLSSRTKIKSSMDNEFNRVSSISSIFISSQGRASKIKLEQSQAEF